MADNIMEAVQAANDTTFGIWFLIGAIMVFFMRLWPVWWQSRLPVIV